MTNGLHSLSPKEITVRVSLRVAVKFHGQKIPLLGSPDTLGPDGEVALGKEGKRLRTDRAFAETRAKIHSDNAMPRRTGCRSAH